MLHILMMILKIIGILILIILGIVLLIICSVLFVPISYKVHGKWIEDKQVKGSISWLFSILRYSFAYENGELVSAIQIFGVRRGDKHREDKKQKGRKEQKSRKAEKKEKEEEKKQYNMDETVPEYEKEYEQQFEKEYETGHIEQEQYIPAVEKQGDNTEKYREEQREKKEEKGLIEKIKEKLSGFFYKIKCKIKRICAIIKNWKEKLEWYRDFWQTESTQNAVAFVKREFFRLLKKLKPQKIKGYLRIGLDNPASTGQIYGGLCVLQSFAFMDVKVIPEFEQKVLEADCYIKGRLIVFMVLKTAVKIYFNKDVQQTREQWKNKV